MRRKIHPWMVLVFAVCLTAACGADQEAGAASEGAADQGEEAAAQEPGGMTPAELGDAIGGLYVEAMEDVVAAMEGQPEPDELRPEVGRLKETYVARMVELGRAREALDEADRATVDSHVGMAVRGVPSETFSAYAEGQRHYMDVDRELADEIAAFNVLTQYANFDLLKKQEPAEAERLGIQ